jgi:hypothetical protein
MPEGAWTGLTIIVLVILTMCATVVIMRYQRVETAEPAAEPDLDDADAHDLGLGGFDLGEPGGDGQPHDEPYGGEPYDGEPYSEESRQPRR